MSVPEKHIDLVHGLNADRVRGWFGRLLCRHRWLANGKRPIGWLPGGRLAGGYRPPQAGYLGRCRKCGKYAMVGMGRDGVWSRRIPKPEHDPRLSFTCEPRYPVPLRYVRPTGHEEAPK